MLFNDKDCTFIFLDEKNPIIKIKKENNSSITLITREISCVLHYTNDAMRDEDYKKILERVKEKC